MSKYLDQVGLDKLIQLIKNALVGKVDKETGKSLSTNDYTTAEKEKLAGIEAGAEVNIIESVSVNGTAQTVTNKAVDITVPTATSDLTNDSGFITAEDVPDGAVASTATPLMDGTAAVGVSTAFARGDHVHPSDTAKVDKEAGKGLSTNDYTTAEKDKLAGIETGAEENVIEAISVNNTAQTVTSKAVNITVPTKVSDLTNDSGFQTSQEVSAAITAAIAGVYTPKGTVTFANLPTAGSGNLGWVYNISNAFTTTAAFVEGAGSNYTAGTNVVCVSTGTDTYAWDVLGGTFDVEELTVSEVQTLWDSN